MARMTVGWQRVLKAVVVCLTLLCFADQVHAIDESIPLNLLERTAFHSREGAPGGIQAVAQDSNGLLWLGTSGGLYQFDGVSFRRYQPPGLQRLPDLNFAVLVAAPGGGVWGATRFGHVYYMTEKSLRIFGAADGLPEHTLYGLTVDAAGQVWVGSPFGVFHLVKNRWVAILKVDGTPATAGGYDCLKVDGHGDLWMHDIHHLSVLRANADHFVAVRDIENGEGIFVDRQGEAWLSDSSGIHSLSEGRIGIPESKLPGPKRNPVNRSYVYFVDSAGMAWGLTAGGDAFRVPLPQINGGARKSLPGSAPHAYAERVSNIDMAIRPFWVEDLEGNVWITSSSGLDRLRSTKLHRVVIDNKAVGAGGLAVSESGVLWTSSADGLYRRAYGEGFTRVDIGPSPPCANCGVFAAKDGNFYRGYGGALQRLGHSGYEPMPQPTNRANDSSYHAISEDEDGNPWVSVTYGKGVFASRAGKWTRFDLRKGVPEAALSMTRSGGRLWLGYLHGTLAVVRNGATRLLSEKDGLAIGDVLVVAAHGKLAWLAGTNGLAYFDGDRVRTVVAKRRPWTGVSGLIWTPEGDLWMNGEEGVQRISKEELAAFVSDPTHQVTDELFDVHAGIEGTPVQFEPIPTAARTSDGLLWFSTSAGLFSIDPRHIASNRIAPHVAVLSVQSNSSKFSGDSVSLAPRTSAIEISYTAPVLAVPELAQFKYRLQGVDAGWQDAGGRRTAFYTNLQPGSYRFQVMAANEDGVWSDRSADMTIVIAPAYWQTTWFRAGLAGLGVLLVAICALLWHTTRLRRVRRGLRLEAGIQQAERERIARDLHDTLIQNMYAFVWRMDVISRTFPTDDGRRMEMSEALDRAESALGAGRERIFSPREPSRDDEKAMVECLRDLGLAWSADTGIGFAIDIRNEVPLRPEIVSLLRKILSEAIVNAFRHGGASQVTMTMRFDDDRFSCVVSDNGAGISPELLERPPEGHLGLRLMRDRAATLGARLLIQSRASGGTEVVLSMTSRRAYVAGRFLRRLSTGLRPLRERLWPSTRLPRDVPAVCE